MSTTTSTRRQQARASARQECSTAMREQPVVTHVVTVLRTLGRTNSISMLGRAAHRGDPFYVLISAVLSTRARDEVTEVITQQLFERFPDHRALAEADLDEVMRLVRRIGFYRNKAQHIIACAVKIRDCHNGTVPHTYEELLELPGVGRKVAGCVLVYGFGAPAIPVDTHVHRVANRLGWVATRAPEQTEPALVKLVPKQYWVHVNEVLVIHGKEICKPGVPRCGSCPVTKHCAYAIERRGLDTYAQ